jgi:hypothetical protein
MTALPNASMRQGQSLNEAEEPEFRRRTIRDCEHKPRQIQNRASLELHSCNREASSRHGGEIVPQ